MAKLTSPTIIDKKARIEAELEAAGVVHRRAHPFTANYLPRVIHDDEHIHAAVFGRRKESEGFFGFTEGMLVATDQKVIFLDHRPGYTTMDEVSYNNVSGVNLSTTIIYASVTLFTKITNYKISFANLSAAQHFTDYIEDMTIARKEPATPPQKPAYEAPLADKALHFLQAHDVGVLSTVERTGALSGAAIYYTIRGDYPYFITKGGSKKADNILGNQHVAFTVFDEANIQTAQLQGIVEQVEDEALKSEVITTIIQARTYSDGSHTPPVLRTGSSDIQVYKIIPTQLNFTDYREH